MHPKDNTGYIICLFFCCYLGNYCVQMYNVYIDTILNLYALQYECFYNIMIWNSENLIFILGIVQNNNRTI